MQKRVAQFWSHICSATKTWEIGVEAAVFWLFVKVWYAKRTYQCFLVKLLVPQFQKNCSMDFEFCKTKLGPCVFDTLFQKKAN